jgi:hypothetical protein
MTSLEGRAHRASKRISRLRSLPDGHRKRPTFTVLNGPLMARQSLVPNQVEHSAQRGHETGVLVGDDQPPPGPRSFWLRRNARQYTSTSEWPTSDQDLAVVAGGHLGATWWCNSQVEKRGPDSSGPVQIRDILRL